MTMTAPRLHTEFHIRRSLKKAVLQAGGLVPYAERTKQNPMAVSDVMAGYASPSAEICHALRFAPVTRYVRVRKG